MKTGQTKVFVADFETTVYAGQTSTEVWAAAIVELNTEDVKIYHSIDELFEYICSFDFNSIIYFHNLKFDGEFWIHFLLTKTDFTQAFCKDENCSDGYFKKRYQLKSKEFIYSISSKGMWYSITIRNGVHFIEIRDSLKLIPTTVKKMGQSFKTKHQKTSIEYTGYRYAGCEITDIEKEYIANDVLVVKEALEIMYKEGHKSLTIGACCLQEYKAVSPFLNLDESLPNLYEIPFPKDEKTGEYEYDFGSDTYGSYIRKSYRGGWCYVVDEKKGKFYEHGTTADVNSLYPSMMHSESGNKYPIGEPTFWIGNYIPDEAKEEKRYYFVRIKTQFKIKPNKLPCIQVKGSPLYRANEWLRTSDYYSKVDNEYHSTIIDLNGNTVPVTVTLTLTETDFKLIQEHYYLYNCEILDGCYFRSAVGIFDEYIDKYKEIKIKSKGAIREIAKLFLNNLYGKMATSTDASFKVAILKDDKSLGYITIIKNDKKPGYIPIGSAITSYARNFTIRAAQKNYYGIKKPGFIYADTDSIHCDLLPEQIKGIKVDDTAFCCWKLESCWDKAVFLRQKTYAEHITHENLKEKPNPYWTIKCAGMPEFCKDLFLLSINEYTAKIINSDWLDLVDDEYKTASAIEFLSKTRTIKDFNYNLSVPGKLLPKHIDGGLILEDTIYTMKEKGFLI